MSIFFVSVKVDLLLPVDVDIDSCLKTYFLNIKTNVKFAYEKYSEEFLENVIPMLSSLAESYTKLSNTCICFEHSLLIWYYLQELN